MDGDRVCGRAVSLQESKVTLFSSEDKKPFLLSREERVFAFKSEAFGNCFLLL